MNKHWSVFNLISAFILVTIGTLVTEPSEGSSAKIVAGARFCKPAPKPIVDAYLYGPNPHFDGTPGSRVLPPEYAEPSRKFVQICPIVDLEGHTVMQMVTTRMDLEPNGDDGGANVAPPYSTLLDLDGHAIGQLSLIFPVDGDEGLDRITFSDWRRGRGGAATSGARDQGLWPWRIDLYDVGGHSMDGPGPYPPFTWNPEKQAYERKPGCYETRRRTYHTYICDGKPEYK